MGLETSTVCRQETLRGTVMRKTLGRYFVRTGEGVVACAISSKLRKRLIYPTADPTSITPHVVAVKDITTADPVAIGDEVVFIDEGHQGRMITEIMPRRSRLSRPDPGGQLEQVIAANIDQVVPVFAAAQPAPKWELLDRYLASAEASDLPPLIAITKMDLAKREAIAEEMRVYQNIGYRVVFTSAPTGEGIAELKDALRGKVSVLVGKSGVGKTTLLNAVEPGLGLRVSEVSQSTGKGKHTTSHLEMFEVDLGGAGADGEAPRDALQQPEGGTPKLALGVDDPIPGGGAGTSPPRTAIIDTPGIREFGLWAVNGTDLASLFPEMRPYLGHCRFGADCSHSHEPDCAIKQAVETGHIARRRYESYRRLR